MIFRVFVVICAVAPLVSVVTEWVVGRRLTERHHSTHDTYVISTALTGALSLAMQFMGLLGILLGWLCHLGVFAADETTMLGFFASFVVAMFVMWWALRRYRVSAYEDYLEVTPFVGRMRTVRYADIEAMRWSRGWTISSNRSIIIYVGGEVAAVLAGTFDLDQILLRINRNDVLENS